MSGNSRSGNADPRSEIVFARERAASPGVRHAAREVPLRGQAVDFSVSRWLPSASGSSSIEAQAREVIDFILGDSDPRLAEIKQRLRSWVDAYPRSPDRALLEHLIETCTRANAQRQPEDAAAPVVLHHAAAR